MEIITVVLILLLAAVILTIGACRDSFPRPERYISASDYIEAVEEYWARIDNTNTERINI